MKCIMRRVIKPNSKKRVSLSDNAPEIQLHNYNVDLDELQTPIRCDRSTQRRVSLGTFAETGSD